MILGESGSGKSASMRSFKEGEIAIINVSSKPLPFRTKLKTYNTDDYMKVDNAIKSAVKKGIKTIVVDDAQYLQSNEYMRKANINGYQKFTEIALNFWSLFQMVIKELPEDAIVYFMAHTETDANGKEKFKTVGKMTDSYSVEGMCTIVLKTLVEDGHYYFTTQTNGYDTVKSPMGMFAEMRIDNDLKAVDKEIREYYNMK